jgi:thiamine transport system permease protein
MQRWLAHSFGLISVMFLGVFFCYPLLVILTRGLSSLHTDVLSNPYYLERLVFTTFQALLSTVLTVILALPTALLFARYSFWGKRFLKVAFTIPFVLPSVVAGIGFLTLVGPRGLSGFNLRGTLSIILLAHVFYNYAVVVRIVSGYLETLGTTLHDAAAMLGAGRWTTLTRVTLPLALPAILASAVLVFIFCFTSFGVIMILAPQPNLATLEVEIYRLLSRLLELDSAALLTLIQLGVVGTFSFIYTRLQARLSVRYAAAESLQKPKGIIKLILFANLGVALVLILSPLITLLAQAFANGLDNFGYLATSQKTIGFTGLGPALKNSMMFATGSTVLALGMGFAFAYSIVRGGWRWLDALSLLPLATSPITLGFGYLLAFPWLSANPLGVLLAHTLLAFPFVARSLLPALRGLPSNLPDAARLLGSSPGQVLWRLELPMLQKALITAASFAFAISLGEFGATLVLQNPAYATLPVAIFDRLGRPGASSYGAALALSVVLMAVAAVVMVILERFED